MLLFLRLTRVEIRFSFVLMLSYLENVDFRITTSAVLIVLEPASLSAPPAAMRSSRQMLDLQKALEHSTPRILSLHISSRSLATR